jgi:hypothetical protein
MTFAGRTVPTRRAAPSYQDWVPLPYMQKAVDHLVARHAGGLALDPGLRKTSITLAAFVERQRLRTGRTMLVIAPLRICRQVWRQEGSKWAQFRHLTFALLHGDKKDKALEADADVYLINPEGVEWLCKQFFGRSLPFDIVTIDELTKFKNSQADRSKALRPRLKGVKTRWGLTGSLAPNGYMDLFGQMLMLDDGAALGRYITHYRDQYFSLGYDGFTYELMPGAEARIINKIAPYWLQMSADDYLTLPPLVEDPILLDMDPKSRKLYNKMKKDMIAQLPEGIITAANAAACYSKLSQMANGAVYVGDNKQAVSHVHDLKLDAIEELVEELNGQPLLIAYEFNHDMDRLRERFGVLDKKTGKKVLPYLGKGTTPTQEDAWIKAWNRNELPILCAHPASAGHGLNLQEGNAGHVAWFGLTWDLELWDQFIRRLRRSGNAAQRIMNHLLIVRGTIDELKLAAIGAKDMTQGRLLKALNAVIQRDADTLAAQGDAVDYRRNDNMVTRLSRPGTEAAAESAPAAGKTPAGWGKAAAVKADDTQRERIQEQIGGGDDADKDLPDRSADAAKAFGRRGASTAAATQETSNGVRTDQGQPAEPAPRRTRSRAAAADDKGIAVDAVMHAAAGDAPPPIYVDAKHTVNVPDTSYALTIQARVALMSSIVASDPAASVEDILLIFDDLWTKVADFAPF